ncbi:hypothetical protein DWS90_23305 [Salmonella enterica subsp. enterica serovar Give]|nr:hypothetical protein [Salmonella enterica]
MFGLNEEQYNAIKKMARECNKELKFECDNGKKYDHVATGIITKHHTPVSTLITRIRFIWLCGHLAERFGKPGEYE